MWPVMLCRRNEGDADVGDGEEGEGEDADADDEGIREWGEDGLIVGYCRN
jgi:hypothetical protein